MAIKFLHDHKVGEGDDLETFKEGQIVTDRSHESEVGFVRRGHAAFIRGNKLLDHEDKVIGTHKAASPRKRATAKPKAAAPKKAAKAKPAKAGK